MYQDTIQAAAIEDPMPLKMISTDLNNRYIGTAMSKYGIIYLLLALEM